MTERLLQFIWQFQYFNRDSLLLESGEQLRIIKPGLLNHHQGPDFKDAIIRINQIQWVGNIEVHIKASDWLKHKHDVDIQYNNVILHIVWENDLAINDYVGNPLPVLVLQNRVAKLLLTKYETLMKAAGIPCHQHNTITLSELGWTAWKERLVAERLQRKANEVLQLFHLSNHHWEEVFWWMLANSFGMKVNAALFKAVAQSIPINILAKHKNQLHQLEALLLGQANLLAKPMEEDYPIMLQKEYQYLQHKYQLQPVSIQPNFLRMRPANFPTLRLAQLAALIHQSSHLFSTIKALTVVKDVLPFFSVTANDYWHYHYRFNQLTEYQPKQVGDSLIHHIIINTVVPVLFAYGIYNKDESCKEKAINWLMQTEAEDNQLVKNWKRFGQPIKSAYCSQAFIELTNNYCLEKRCLDCAIGNKILKG